MKGVWYIMPVFFLVFACFACSSTGYNTQKGAAIGGVIGAIAGQTIGGNTGATLIGTAGGALAGAIAGNAVDQVETRERLGNMEQSQRMAYTALPTSMDSPPGRWVDVSGQWVNGRWVHSHKVWIPVNP